MFLYIYNIYCKSDREKSVPHWGPDTVADMTHLVYDQHKKWRFSKGCGENSVTLYYVGRTSHSILRNTGSTHHNLPTVGPVQSLHCGTSSHLWLDLYSPVWCTVCGEKRVIVYSVVIIVESSFSSCHVFALKLSAGRSSSSIVCAEHMLTLGCTESWFTWTPHLSGSKRRGCSSTRCSEAAAIRRPTSCPQ